MAWVPADRTGTRRGSVARLNHSASQMAGRRALCEPVAGEGESSGTELGVERVTDPVVILSPQMGIGVEGL